MVDYIIVGCGLAGIAFVETALANGKTVQVFENGSFRSSAVAAGVYNPVILKRFSGLQHAQQQLDLLQDFYGKLEKRLGVKVNIPMPILRRFFSIEEQNNWFAASDKPGLSEFLSTQLVTKRFPHVDSPFDFGLVHQTGYVDTVKLLHAYRQDLKQRNLLVESPFEHGDLEFHPTHLTYREIAARHVVFAEGFGITANPYFNHLPLNGTKGEVLIIRAPKLEIDVIVKGNVFVLPLGEGLFKVGATYNWDDKTQIPTSQARGELHQKLAELIDCDYEIIDQQAGIRPTVKDRKPLLGTHPQFSRLHLLNGLGTRGVMLGPYCAQILYANIEDGAEIPPALDLKRFV